MPSTGRGYSYRCVRPNDASPASSAATSATPRPKYKNLPLTHLYDKSVNLYQPLPAPRAPDGRVIVVEGTLDAMAIAVAVKIGQADRFCPITQSGRELSPRQLQTALSLHPGARHVAFDGDPPGRDSSLRLARAVSRAGRRTTTVNLPVGADPASWIADQGPAVPFGL